MIQNFALKLKKISKNSIGMPNSRKKEGSKTNSKKKIRVVELFAGVGGFRLGLEAASSKSSEFEVVWSNQWEPGKKKQWASDIYVARFGQDGHTNEDISEINPKQIPEHDLLVGGFPCQDYSVATSLSQSLGIEGKKGVLWWEICKILEAKKASKPTFVFFENVDRMLKSPANRRGKDFALILASLNQLGYAVEWRVINAADYGMPQRRRRVFLFGYKKGTPEYERLKLEEKLHWLERKGIFARAFPVYSSPTVKKNNRSQGELFPSSSEESDRADLILPKSLTEISDNFGASKKEKSVFRNSGVMLESKVWTRELSPQFGGAQQTLRDILVPDSEVPKHYYIDNESRAQWEYLKGAKDEMRFNKRANATYRYNEGGMVFPDDLDKPSRTIITAEGGSSPSRFKHVVDSKKGFRRLIPEELEALNMFPPGHTKLDGVSDGQRAFFMGNALVVGIVEAVGRELLKRI